MRSPADFDSWAEGFAADWVRSNPQLATMTQYFSGAEQDALDRKLGLTGHFGVTYGRREAEEHKVLAQRGLSALREFDRAALSSEQQSSAAILEWRLQDAIANAAFGQHRFIFTQMIGLHVGLISFLNAMHPIRSERDAENYVARLGAVAGCLDDGISEARGAARKGMIPPRFILERTIGQLDKLSAGDPANHILVTSLADRLNANDVRTSQRDALLDAAKERVVREIIPAFGRVKALLGEQLSRANDNSGAWALPDGASFYARQLATFTGSKLTPAEIHAVGLHEVERLEREMDAILRELGFRDGKLDERVLQLNESLGKNNGGRTRETILTQLQAIVDDAERRSREFFNIRPRAPVTVRREPEFSERSAAAHYSPPAPDGSRPGIYWVPLGEFGPNVPWLGIGMKSTAYHEAIPGHHFQLAIELEAEQLPHFRRRRAFGFDASYGEGWALYSEHTCAENNWYDGDVPSRLGYL